MPPEMQLTEIQKNVRTLNKLDLGHREFTAFTVLPYSLILTATVFIILFVLFNLNQHEIY